MAASIDSRESPWGIRKKLMADKPTKNIGHGMQRVKHPLHTTFLKACGLHLHPSGKDLPDPPTQEEFWENDRGGFYPDGHKVFDYQKDEDHYFSVLRGGGWMSDEEYEEKFPKPLISLPPRFEDLEATDRKTEQMWLNRETLKASLGLGRVDEPPKVNHELSCQMDVCNTLISVADLYETVEGSPWDLEAFEKTAKLFCSFLLDQGPFPVDVEVEDAERAQPPKRWLDGDDRRPPAFRCLTSSEVRDQMPYFPFHEERYAVSYSSGEPWTTKGYYCHIDVDIHSHGETFQMFFQDTGMYIMDFSSKRSWTHDINALDETEMVAVKAFIEVSHQKGVTVIRDQGERIFSSIIGSTPTPGKFFTKGGIGPHRLEFKSGGLVHNTPIFGELGKLVWEEVWKKTYEPLAEKEEPDGDPPENFSDVYKAIEIYRE